MVLKRVGGPKKIFSSTEPAYEERAVWIETDGSGNILNQYVGFFDQWIQIPVDVQFPVHFDYLDNTEPTPNAGRSWLKVSGFTSNSVSTPTTGDNIYEFDITDSSTVFGFDNIFVSGVSNTQSNSFSQTGVSGGDTVSVDVGGTTTAENASIDFTGVTNSISRNYSGNSTGSQSITINGNKNPTGPLNGNPKFSVSINNDSFYESADHDKIVLPSSAPSTQYSIYGSGRTYTDAWLYVNGTEVKTANIYASGEHTFYYDLGPGDEVKFLIEGQYANTTIVSGSAPANSSTTVSTSNGVSQTISNGGSTEVSLDTSDTSISISNSGDPISSWSFDYNDITKTVDPSITIDGETVSYTGTLDDGATQTSTLTNLTPGSYSPTVSTGGTVDVNGSWDEITQTEDPTVDVNGNTISHTGVVPGGETVSLEADKAWLIDGTNTVELVSGAPADLSFDYKEEDSSSSDYTVLLHYSDGSTWTQV